MNDISNSSSSGHGRSLKRFRNKRKSSRGRWILATITGIFFIGVLWFGVTLASAYQKVNDNSTNNHSSPLLKLFGQEVSPDQLQGEGDGRINVLLIGIGGENHPGGLLADTIMVASFDVENNQLALLSIPRDLRVKIPGYGYVKINAAHSYGESQEAGSGPQLLKQTVSDVLDLPIHYYVRADFSGFEQLVDAIGGVDVNVTKALYDPFFPDKQLKGYDPFSVSAGQHHFDGETALKYARSRETTSDFDRAARQQQIMLAARDKLLSLGIMTNPVKITELINIVGDHMKTDITATEMKQFAQYAKNIDTSNIVTKILDNSTDGPLKSISDGGYYLVPKAGDFSEVQRIAHELFTDPYLKREQAAIEILNGTGDAGQALQLEQDLQALGYTIASIDKTDVTARTTVTDYSHGAAPFTVKFLSGRLGVSASIATPPSGTSGIDVRIVLGQDYLKRGQ